MPNILSRITKKITPDPGRKYLSTVTQINKLESSISKLSDEELFETTKRLRSKLDENIDLTEIIPEAFASVRESAKRNLGMRHYDVQLIGGLALNEGKIAEMRTGEGKTLVATLSAYLNALTGTGTHVVTVNDYLAKRDATWMGPVYSGLGMTTSCLQNNDAFVFSESESIEMVQVSRSEAYNADITYGTNSEFGFDYLRDNMALDDSDKVQKELTYAIVDEVDYILIDEARTPLIISSPSLEPSDKYIKFASIAPSLKPNIDFIIDEKSRGISLTAEGIENVETQLSITNLYDPEHLSSIHFLENALKANYIFSKNKEYVVSDDSTITIVDEFTGRLMPGRRYSDGLHQAIEAKERVPIQRESMTLATITLQNYFRMYKKLSGMTGTAMTEAEEFLKIYNLDPITIAPNEPTIREDLADLVYVNEKSKFTAIAEEIKRINKIGSPILVGTASIETSEKVSDLLKRNNIRHSVLNAKQHEQEAMIVAQAGRIGAVTVATNMAGRGTDIILGGSKDGRDESEWIEENLKVQELGGLHILGTERHEARRIDNQLRGRSGRQGDPGCSQFYVSLEDEIIRRFGGDRVKSIIEWAGLEDGESIQNKMVNKAFENAQTKVEGHNFEIRKQLVEYDDVINRQREIVYKEREKALQSESLKDTIINMVKEDISVVVTQSLGSNTKNDWDLESLEQEIKNISTEFDVINILSEANLTEEKSKDYLFSQASEIYETREEVIGESNMRYIERLLLLQTVDQMWVQHLTAMEQMRLGIGLQAYGQRDPLVMYRQQGHSMFQEFLENVRRLMARSILKVSVNKQHNTHLNEKPESNNVKSREVSYSGSETKSEKQGQVINSNKVGRNDPCFCGSGLKFKRCHGQNG
jgi:preprotein translocase subunit SecA